jgi:hypothetical protein
LVVKAKNIGLNKKKAAPTTATTQQRKGQKKENYRTESQHNIF